MYGTGLKEFTTPVVRNLIIINVVVFIICNISPYLHNVTTAFGALYPIQSYFFYPWQFISYMFMHANVMHIFGNMFALYMFGSWLERVWGGKRFLFFYFFTGIGAALIFWGVNSYQINGLKAGAEEFISKPTPELAISYLRTHDPMGYEYQVDSLASFKDHPDNPRMIMYFQEVVAEVYYSHINTPMVGASGAVFGILLAFAMLFPNTELRLLFPPIPIKAKYFVLLYGLFELYMQFKNSPTDNVAHLAHLSGMLFGFILVKYWNKQRNSFY